MNCRRSFLSLISALSALAAVSQTQALVLVDDTFSNPVGTNPNQFGWYSQNTSSSGTPWSINTNLQSLAAPAFSGVWTSALRSFSSTTLNVGEKITLSLDVSRASSAVGNLQIGFFNYGSALSSNLLGTTVNYATTLNSLVQEPITGTSAHYNSLPGQTSGSIALEGSGSTRIVFSLERTAASTLRLSATVGGVTLVPYDMSGVSAFTFDTIRLYTPSNNPGGAVYFDNVKAELVPEPSAALLAFGGVVLLALFRRRN